GLNRSGHCRGWRTSPALVKCRGRPPFRDAKTIAVLKRVVEDTPRSIEEINPKISEWLCELISRLHAKNPADRITSAQDVAELLAQRMAVLQGSGNVSSAWRFPKADETRPRGPPSVSSEAGSGQPTAAAPSHARSAGRRGSAPVASAHSSSVLSPQNPGESP